MVTTFKNEDVQKRVKTRDHPLWEMQPIRFCLADQSRNVERLDQQTNANIGGSQAQ